MINTILGGEPYQTFSARNWERKRNGLPNLVWLIDGLLYFDQDHCMDCWIIWKHSQLAVAAYNEKRLNYELRRRETNPC